MHFLSVSHEPGAGLGTNRNPGPCGAQDAKGRTRGLEGIPSLLGSGKTQEKMLRAGSQRPLLQAAAPQLPRSKDEEGLGSCGVCVCFL